MGGLRRVERSAPRRPRRRAADEAVAPEAARPVEEAVCGRDALVELRHGGSRRGVEAHLHAELRGSGGVLRGVHDDGAAEAAEQRVALEERLRHDDGRRRVEGACGQGRTGEDREGQGRTGEDREGWRPRLVERCAGAAAAYPQAWRQRARP